MIDPSNKSRSLSLGKRGALVVGHPGHELLVHGLLEAERPVVFVLTDGSGRSNQSRLDATKGIVEQTGTTCGNIFGRLTDRAAYAAIMNYDVDLFLDLSRELSDAFVADGIDWVAGDASEGYNPVHDVCRLIINAAVKIAGEQSGSAITNLEFALVNERSGLCNEPHANSIWRLLDDEAFARKMSAAKDYVELAGEVSAALARASSDCFRIECLHAASESVNGDGNAIPFYEQYGEAQVAAGHYDQVLRYRQHVLPIAAALERCADSTLNVAVES
jgi:hypothetical protein